MWILSKEMRKNQKICDFVQISKIWVFDKWNVKRENSIGDNLTTKYRKNTCDTALENSKSRLVIEELHGK